MIQASNVSCVLGGQQVLTDVSMRVRTGETVGLVGPNGSGKTTLLRTLYGRQEVTEGQVMFNGAPLAGFGRKQLARQMAVALQHPGDAGESTVEETVALGRAPHLGWAGQLSDADFAAVATAMARCGVDGLAHRRVDELSGGQQQRVMLAKTLAQDTDFILLDEPTNHLDLRFQHEVLATVTGLGAGVCAVLHDLNLANTYCDRVVLLNEGRVVAAGTPEEVLVPEVLEPVYQVPVEKVEVNGRTHLLLGPGGATGEQSRAPAHTRRA